MPETGKPYGLIAEFDTPAATMHAAEKVRDAGFKKWDVFTPYPVHGLDQAMGLKSSKVGWFSFLGGGDRIHARQHHDLVDERPRLRHRHRWQADVQPVQRLPALV